MLRGSATPRIWTKPLVTGPPGPCECGCALTPDTSLGFAAIEFATEDLGLSLYPYQRWLFIHALELRADRRSFRFRTILIEISRQNGKALDLDTPILTENRGWTTMGGILPGDRVFHPAGHAVGVTYRSTPEVGHECFEVTTTDGRKVVADADHLWTVVDKRFGKKERTLTTRQLLGEGLHRGQVKRRVVAGGKAYEAAEYRWTLPTQEPIKSPDVSLPIDPYVFGAWLGDGHSAQARLSCHVEDVGHWEASFAAAGYEAERRSDRTCESLAIRAPGFKRSQTESFQAKLRIMGVLGRKHVPDIYLTASASQREALLQGLMDTDGSIEARRGQVEFCSTNKDLADAALYLARSLGWRATVATHRATLRGVDCGERYRVCFTPVRTDPFIPFRLPRKAGRVKAVDGGKGRSVVSIKGIVPVETRPVRCIKVDSPDGLFLAGRGLVPTHNTTFVDIKNLFKLFVLHVPLVIGTAQNLDVAEESWEKGLEIVESTPALASKIVRVSRTNGKKEFELVSGARWKPVAANRAGGRGASGDDVNFDELREHLHWGPWAATSKTTMARPNAQIWAYTNAGDERSVVLNELQKTGRSNADPSFGYFSWSAPDDPEDPDTYIRCTCGGTKPHAEWCKLLDRKAWAQANPALGYGLLTEEALLSAANSDPEPVFRTECLCQRVPDLKPTWLIVSERQWLSRRTAEVPRERLVFSVQVSYDRSMTTIAACGQRDGKRVVTVIEHRAGTAWVPDRLDYLRREYNPLLIVVQDKGPTGTVYEALPEKDEYGSPVWPRIEDRDEPVQGDVVAPWANDVAIAHGLLLDAALRPEGDLLHTDDAPVNVALAHAEMRPLGGGRTWQEKGDHDAGPLQAVTLAHWGHVIFADKVRPAGDGIGVF